MKPYLVVVWDKADDTFWFTAVLASSEKNAKHQGWIERLDNAEIPENGRDKEYSRDGGKTGFVPVLAVERTELDRSFAETECDKIIPVNVILPRSAV